MNDQKNGSSCELNLLLFEQAVTGDVDEIYHQIIVAIDVVLNVHGFVADWMSFTADFKIGAEDPIEEGTLSFGTIDNFHRHYCETFVADPVVVFVERNTHIIGIFADER